jgi:MFS family permease
MGVGGIQSIIPGYLSEVAPVRIRGGVLMMYSFWWTIGGLLGSVALQDLNARDSLNYKTPIYTQWALIGLMFFFFLAVPESPAWSVSTGRIEQAKKSLTWLNGKVEGFDVEQQTHILIQLAEHEHAVAVEQKRESWWAIFRGVDRTRTIISLWTILTQQFIGLTLFATFGTYFFQQAGLQDPFIITVITACIQLATVLVIVLIADYIGRRNLACSGTTVCWLACISIGVIGVAPQSNASTYVFVLFACIWNVGLAINGATGWGYIGEISSQRLRPYTAGFSAAVSCIVGVVMNILVPYMVNVNQWAWGLKTGFFYAGVGLPSVVGMWLLIPETTGWVSQRFIRSLMRICTDMSLL